ncbi:MAG: hypothetical protein JWN41_804 [Thermoleophilia bacterium]|nr:hypothetical protein [Thermoleophilia bacterium]
MVVALWRLSASLAGEHARLARSGELAARHAERRARHIARALAVVRAQPPVPVAVRVRVDDSVHRSVQVGELDASAIVDVDDIDLLRASMQRRPRGGASEVIRAVATTARVEIPDDFTWLELDAQHDVTPSGVGVLGPLLVTTGVAGTFVPLVRPLGDVAPWVALASLALVALGLWRLRAE